MTGQTMTYGEIAAQIAQRKGLTRMSAQAVGGAVGHNGISIIIPCHRVVGTKGNLTGYAGGLDKKMALLELEHANRKTYLAYCPKISSMPCRNSSIVFGEKDYVLPQM